MQFLSRLIANFHQLELVINSIKPKDHDMTTFFFHKNALGMCFLMRNISSAWIILLPTVLYFPKKRKRYLQRFLCWLLFIYCLNVSPSTPSLLCFTSASVSRIIAVCSDHHRKRHEAPAYFSFLYPLKYLTPAWKKFGALY